MKIPFVDLKAQNESFKEEFLQATNKLIDNNSFILGQEVKLFESEFAKFCNASFCVGCSSGSAALYIALKCLGIKSGDEVITVPNTFIATTQAITLCGGKIIFVDVDKETHLMKVNKLEEAITSKTKVILPVHLHGQVCDMKLIMQIAKKYDLRVLEDACQAHGAEYFSKKSPIGDTAVYSFYPSKNLGTLGDSGAIVTNDKNLFDKSFAFRDYGRMKGEKYILKKEGFNLRMNSLQAAFLNIKLKYLDDWNDKRRKNAKLYNKFLKNVVITPTEKKQRKHVYYVYVIMTDRRDELKKFLLSKNIDTRIHFPIPIYSQPLYKNLEFDKKDFPNTEILSRNSLSLPMFPELTKEKIMCVCKHIKKFYSHNA